MSTRYVWDIYNYTETKKVIAKNNTVHHNTILDLPRYTRLYYTSYDYSINGNTVILNNPYSTNPGDSSFIGPSSIMIIGKTQDTIDNVYIASYRGNASWREETTIEGTFIGINFSGYQDAIIDTKYNIGTKISIITSSNESDYPSNNIQDSYWYKSVGSDNIDPTAISYPSSIKGGQAITLTTTKSSGIKYGGTITYTYEVQLNGGRWTSIGSTTSLTKSYTVPAGTTTFRARVKAKDNMGFASTTYVTGNRVTVINNSAPTISGSNSNLGSFAYIPPYIEYIINDADRNTVSVSIQLDSQSIYSGTAVLGKTKFIIFPDWDSLLNGSHTITITANDSQGGVTTRTYTFSKSVNANLISRERWRRLNEGNVYDVIYFETAADVVTTNNGKYLRDRINAIRSRIAALKGTSAAALAAMDSNIITERLHMKTDSGYNVKYLDTKSQYVKIGSQTVEDVLTQIESDIAALKG